MRVMIKHTPYNNIIIVLSKLVIIAQLFVIFNIRVHFNVHRHNAFAEIRKIF